MRTRSLRYQDPVEIDDHQRRGRGLDGPSGRRIGRDEIVRLDEADRDQDQGLRIAAARTKTPFAAVAHLD